MLQPYLANVKHLSDCCQYYDHFYNLNTCTNQSSYDLIQRKSVDNDYFGPRLNIGT